MAVIKFSVWCKMFLWSL